MKLKLKCCSGVHKEMVTAVAWTPDNELYSMSDDNTIHRWDGSGDPAGKVWYVENGYVHHVPKRHELPTVILKPRGTTAVRRLLCTSRN